MTKKEITKEEAEKLLKSENDKHLHEHNHDHGPSVKNKKRSTKKTITSKKAKTLSKGPSKAKKVSKK